MKTKQSLDTGAVKVVDPISVANITTKGGHELRVFFNAATNLLVIDLNHKERAGGNELVRMTLDEDKLLKHCDKLPRWEDA